MDHLRRAVTVERTLLPDRVVLSELCEVALNRGLSGVRLRELLSLK
jgi:hypothetical protein